MMNGDPIHENEPLGPHGTIVSDHSELCPEAYRERLSRPPTFRAKRWKGESKVSPAPPSDRDSQCDPETGLPVTPPEILCVVAVHTPSPPVHDNTALEQTMAPPALPAVSETNWSGGFLNGRATTPAIKDETVALSDLEYSGTLRSLGTDTRGQYQPLRGWWHRPNRRVEYLSRRVADRYGDYLYIPCAPVDLTRPRSTIVTLALTLLIAIACLLMTTVVALIALAVDFSWLMIMARAGLFAIVGATIMAIVFILATPCIAALLTHCRIACKSTSPS